VSKGALIFGGSPAGLQAALDLADAGIKVHLIEPSPFFGNGGSTMTPAHLLNARMLEAAKHPRIKMWTNTRLQSAERKTESLHVQCRFSQMYRMR
jgi:heterodisulfide reductase subunit A